MGAYLSGKKIGGAYFAGKKLAGMAIGGKVVWRSMFTRIRPLWNMELSVEGTLGYSSQIPLLAHDGSLIVMGQYHYDSDNTDTFWLSRYDTSGNLIFYQRNISTEGYGGFVLDKSDNVYWLRHALGDSYATIYEVSENGTLLQSKVLNLTTDSNAIVELFYADSSRLIFTDYQNKVFISDTNGNSFKTILLPNSSWQNPVSSVACDGSYIYALVMSSNNLPASQFAKYDFNGNLVKSVSIPAETTKYLTGSKIFAQNGFVILSANTLIYFDTSFKNLWSVPISGNFMSIDEQGSSYWLNNGLMTLTKLSEKGSQVYSFDLIYPGTSTDTGLTQSIDANKNSICVTTGVTSVDGKATSYLYVYQQY